MRRLRPRRRRQPSEPFDADKAKADKRAALDQRIAELNAKTSPWVYAIPTWKTANVKKKVWKASRPRADAGHP